MKPIIFFLSIVLICSVGHTDEPDDNNDKEKSKTEEAKERLDKATKDNSSSRKSNYRSTRRKCNSKSTSWIETLFDFLDLLSDITPDTPKNTQSSETYYYYSNMTPDTTITSDIPKLTYSKKISYFDYPYYSDQNFSYQDTSAQNAILFFSHISFGNSVSSDFVLSSFSSTFHFSRWAIKMRYKYIDEYSAPFPINFISGQFERKIDAFNGVDMGFSIGMDRIALDRNYYDGLTLGYNFELFLFKPVSIVFNPSIMFYENEKITDTYASINYHIKNLVIGFEYNKLNIIGVSFDSFSLKLGLYH
ncbi:MAG: hypothetical protein HN921_13565 [Bacteroidetes bacterium]|jgi:hypothetical protein|nr:hypothetical protein [Candidatus Neomarinimicrobiota bacterium]MBT5528785.1 hypothetical protein [Cytophagia bacterium]MBT7040859.1 hypothetical protein [Bacteroidota bacterium]MBT4852675.1 hypothetical protein [Candidatus Neomarinimicrobiota bacterium]MBT6217498.1 hypothetical protein [Candidatus Neomarinimicrobiota bacterium]